MEASEPLPIAPIKPAPVPESGTHPTAVVTVLLALATAVLMGTAGG